VAENLGDIAVDEESNIEESNQLDEKEGLVVFC